MLIFLVIFIVAALGFGFLMLTIIRAATKNGRCTKCGGSTRKFVYVDKVHGRLCQHCAEKILQYSVKNSIVN
jgi:hypothetical protein